MRLPLKLIEQIEVSALQKLQRFTKKQVANLTPAVLKDFGIDTVTVIAKGGAEAAFQKGTLFVNKQFKKRTLEEKYDILLHELLHAEQFLQWPKKILDDTLSNLSKVATLSIENRLIDTRAELIKESFKAFCNKRKVEVTIFFKSLKDLASDQPKLWADYLKKSKNKVENLMRGEIKVMAKEYREQNDSNMEKLLRHTKACQWNVRCELSAIDFPKKVRAALGESVSEKYMAMTGGYRKIQNYMIQFFKEVYKPAIKTVP